VISGGQIGWICPTCERTYSPAVPSCTICGRKDYFTTTTAGPTAVDVATCAHAWKPTAQGMKCAHCGLVAGAGR
jgi:hypothetical protein